MGCPLSTNIDNIPRIYLDFNKLRYELELYYCTRTTILALCCFFLRRSENSCTYMGWNPDAFNGRRVDMECAVYNQNRY